MYGEKKISVSLVLGSGGARGLAHIGAIQWLEENGYDIRSISGSSIGALIGGIYACGKLKACEEWVRAVSKADVIKLHNTLQSEHSPIDDESILEPLKGLLGDRQIESLPIKFTAVAADIKREKEVWLRSGSLLDAVRASISLPPFLTPFEINDIKCLDGGILSPVPIAPTLLDDNELTIAINLSAEPRGTPEPKLGNETRSFDEQLNKDDDVLDDLKNGSRLAHSGSWATLSATLQAFDVMQGEIARQKLAADPPDSVIMIARDVCGMLEFDRAEEIISLGYESAARSLGRSEAISYGAS
jgi:NTE family protein